MRIDEYGMYTIRNIYYDSEDEFLLRNSISKPAYKEKLRLRSYNTPSSNSKVYLEIKKKFNGYGNKRRISLTLNEAYNFIKRKKRPFDSQIAKEIEYLINLYDIKHIYFIAYDRTAYTQINSDLRITIDTNIRSRKDNLKLEVIEGCQNLFSEEYYIMEIKTTTPYPIWLRRVLNKEKIFPTSFSKVGAIYELERRKKNV